MPIRHKNKDNDRGATGSVDLHFFEYAVYMRRLTLPFLSHSDFHPHLSLPSTASEPDQTLQGSNTLSHSYLPSPT